MSRRRFGNTLRDEVALMRAAFADPSEKAFLAQVVELAQCYGRCRCCREPRGASI